MKGWIEAGFLLLVAAGHVAWAWSGWRLGVPTDRVAAFGVGVCAVQAIFFVWLCGVLEDARIRRERQRRFVAHRQLTGRWALADAPDAAAVKGADVAIARKYYPIAEPRKEVP